MADRTPTFALATLGIHLPLALDPEELGNVVDATGTHVLQVDINRDRPDAQVVAIAEAVASAVNAAAPTRATKPYAYEFGRSNGDGTFGVVIERGEPRSPIADWPVKPLYATPAATALDAAPSTPSRTPFGPGDDFDAMAETFRRQILEIAIRAHDAAVYRDLSPEDQMLCIMAGIVHGLLCVCFAAIQPDGRDAMLEAIADYLPVARQNVEETEAKPEAAR